MKKSKPSPETPTQTAKTSLANQLLISMPHMTDPNFAQSVALICQHDARGAMGVIINRPTLHQAGDIFAELSIQVKDSDWLKRPVLQGGPVAPEVGLVIHAQTPGQQWESSLPIGDGLRLTSSKDILQALADGNGPERAVISLGYAGWGAGQLEAELRQNAWLSAPVDQDIIFDPNPENKWRRAAGLLGIDPLQISTRAGNA